MEDLIDIVVAFDVHLAGIKDVEIAHVQLNVATSVRNRALTCKSFGHIVILNVSKSFDIVLGSFAAQVVRVLNQREDSSVHLHELDERHTFSCELFHEIQVENLGECGKDDINLLIIKNLQGSLILELKVSLVNQKQAWKAEQINDKRNKKNNRAEHNCE